MPRAFSPSSTALLDSGGRRNRALADPPCCHGGIPVRPRDAQSKYCSRPCMWANNGKGQSKPDGHSYWWVTAKGYIEGKVWKDGRPIQMKQHRFVMESVIGRALLADEDVHHRNGNKTDNSPENLELITHGEHSRHHSAGRVHKRGYKINISPDERAKRSNRMKAFHAQVALKAARGES